jgi:radical SAM superfamily enzyme YgiQ (UPF0313 family)
VGLSIRNIDDVNYPQTTCYVDLYKRVVTLLRKATDAPIVVGGAGFTIMPEAFLEALEVDYGVVGEGEAAMAELARFIAGGDRGALPEGVTSRSAGEARPRRDPSWSRVSPRRGLFSADDYYEKGGALNLQTRRGCPFRCAYCSYPHIEGSRVRLRPVAEAIDEVEQLVASTGARHLFIVDSVFNHPRDYALAFCDELIGRKVEVAWSCYAQAGRMDGELIERMVRAGCEGVEFGTDALVDEILANLEKGFTFAEVAESSRLCRELGLRFCHFIFVGSPGEGPDEVRLGLDRLAALEADASVIMSGIRVLPGTTLAERARADLGITDPGLEPVYYISPALAGQVEALADQIVKEHPSWVLPGFRRNFNERIQKVLRRSGMKGVLWDYLSDR